MTIISKSARAGARIRGRDTVEFKVSLERMIRIHTRSSIRLAQCTSARKRVGLGWRHAWCGSCKDTGV